LRLAPTTLLSSASLLLLPLTACKKGTQVPDETGDPGPVIIEHCGEITGDEIWTTDATHVLSCDVTVTGSLQLDPGVEVYAARDTTLLIDGGSLVALGESDAGILLGSYEGFPLAGDWVGLVGNAADIQLSWVTLRHAGSSGPLLSLTDGTASLEQVFLSNGISSGLSSTGTSFELIQGLEVAYVPMPLELPWTAAQALSAVFFQEVGTEAIVLTEPTLSADATLPEQDFPYRSDGVIIQDGGRLEVGAGALLEMAGELAVEDGSIIAYGDQITGATIQAYDLETGFSISIGSEATAATFRYATIVGATVSSDAAELYFEDCDITDSLGTALTVTGGIKDAHPDNFTDNSFSGAGYGLLIDFDLLSAVGVNDFSGASFDGVAVAGGTVSTDTAVTEWPSEQVLITADLELASGTHSLVGGTLLFADGTSLALSDGSLTAQGMVLMHQGETSGGWYGVHATGGELSILDSTVSHGGAHGGANLTVATDATITGNTINYSAGWGILVGGDASPTIEDNSYQNNALGDVGP
jgi:parallel beta-helix repeat protein